MLISLLLLGSFGLAAGPSVASAPAPDAFGADTAFAQNFLTGSRQIVSFPVGAPTSMTVVGPQTDSLTGMDFDPGATVLWAVNFTTQTLGTINQTTGAYTPSVALQGGCCVRALTIDPVHGVFYVAKGDEFIHRLDPATGATILLGVGADPGSQISALAMDCTGRMFALDGVSSAGNLYRVRFDGSPILVGFPGMVSGTSLEFDNQNGTLYGWFNGSGNDFSTHATVSTANAQLSQSSLVAGRFRMAIRNVCSVEQVRLFVNGFEG